MTARRPPRASGLEVVVSTGERIRLAGRFAEVLVAFLADLAERPHLQEREFWQVQIDVSQGRVICRFSETGAPRRFRDAHTA